MGQKRIILDTNILISALVSGDEHLLKFKEFKDAKIVTAKEFLEVVKEH